MPREQREQVIQPEVQTEDVVKINPEHRVTLRAKPSLAERKRIYGPFAIGNIMRILWKTNGIIFPYTPTITSSFNVEYGQYTPVHSIQEFQAYTRTPSPTFNIMGDFTAQTEEEAEYCLAVIHFFRSLTKMYFGRADANKLGVVPPVVMFNGYGNLMFNNLPVLITSYNIEFMNNVDYVRVKPAPADRASDATKSADERSVIGNSNPVFSTNQAEAWVPSKFTITTTIVVQHAPQHLRDFDLDKFRTGELLRTRSNTRGGWW